MRLLPFELRFLAWRQPPDRWVVDLGRGDDVLVPTYSFACRDHAEPRCWPATVTPNIFV